MVEPWTGVNAVYVLCLVALFCYMPGMKIMELVEKNITVSDAPGMGIEGFVPGKVNYLA